MSRHLRARPFFFACYDARLAIRQYSRRGAQSFTCVLNIPLRVPPLLCCFRAHKTKVPVIKGTEFQLHMHNLDVMVHCSKLISLTNTIGSASLLGRSCLLPFVVDDLWPLGSLLFCFPRSSACATCTWFSLSLHDGGSGCILLPQRFYR